MNESSEYGIRGSEAFGGTGSSFHLHVEEVSLEEMQRRFEAMFEGEEEESQIEDVSAHVIPLSGSSSFRNLLGDKVRHIW